MVNSLFIHLCSPSNFITDLRKDEAYRDLFLASYRSFIGAQSLLDLLLDRFEKVSEWIPDDNRPQERANARVR